MHVYILGQIPNIYVSLPSLWFRCPQRNRFLAGIFTRLLYLLFGFVVLNETVSSQAFLLSLSTLHRIYISKHFGRHLV